MTLMRAVRVLDVRPRTVVVPPFGNRTRFRASDRVSLQLMTPGLTT